MEDDILESMKWSDQNFGGKGNRMYVDRKQVEKQTDKFNDTPEFVA